MGLVESLPAFTKVCSKCGVRKHLSEFNENFRYKDDYFPYCKSCASFVAVVRKYGISIENYNKLFEDQNGCCAICGRHQIEFKTKLAVDHDHETKKIRGLLCSLCNTGVGQFKEDPIRLRAAADYLERYLED